MAQTWYPTLEEAIWLHDSMIQRFGGEPGVRDMGLLESALHRPRSGYYPALSVQAAALLQSLAGNHCFLDGNKRMAFGLTVVFLAMNGHELRVTADEGERFLVHEVIETGAQVERIAQWLEEHLVRRA